MYRSLLDRANDQHDQRFVCIEREREIFDEKDDRVVYSSNKINASPFLPFDFEEVEGLLKKPGQKWRINVRVQKGFTSRGF